MMQKDVFEAALAGLLHDIGKFAQRAAEGKQILWDADTEREFKYEHTLHTDGVVEQIVPRQWREAVRAAAGRHHKPQTALERVVCLADRLSAGERADSGERQPRLLQSIFCSLDGVTTDEKGNPIEPPEEKKYLPLKKLAIKEDVIFPVDAVDDKHGTYKDLWDEFLAEAKKLKAAHEENGSKGVYLDSVLNLMQQYTWCIPSAYYRSVPDVSLYDHSRMTAALAACLVGENDAKISRLLAKQSDEPVALLVGGDISGVQKFIYTITSQGATGGLRGRSMYLQLLTEVMARYILTQFDLPHTNVIYAGGGHFFMLLPADSETKLAEIQRQISRILLHHHQGDLYLALSWAAINPAQAAGDALRESWDKMQKGLQQHKQRKFAELGDELATLLFAPKEHGGNEEKQCAVCQREHPQSYKKKDEEKVVCPACRQFEELGKDLRRAAYLTLDRVEIAPLPANGNPPGDWRAVLQNFGYRAEVSQDLPHLPKSDFQARTLLALNDNEWKNLQPAATQSVGRHLLVNVTPILTGDEYNKFKTGDDDLPKRFVEKDAPVKPFDIMTQQSRGIKRLGILRMDVDNLGQILSQGFRGDKFTFSRIAALSFNISLFFEGWLEQIAREINAKGCETANNRDGVYDDSDLIYSIYSGGDDLFFVGAWDLMPLLAERISLDLQKFTAGHAGIHISGGVALIPGKYPLYQAADDAAGAERAAKARRRDGGEKNALDFLGQTVSWQKFSDVKEYQRQLEMLITEKDVPKSLLQRLVQLYIEFDNSRKTQEGAGKKAQVYWGPGQWRSAYSLSRLAERRKNAKDEIIKLRNDLHLDNFNNIEWLGLAARWTGLITRKGE